MIAILPLPKGRGLDRVGDDLGQGVDVGDLLELGVDLDLDGDSPVLVHAVLLDGALHRTPFIVNTIQYKLYTA